jgi:hypothetical protein
MHTVGLPSRPWVGAEGVALSEDEAVLVPVAEGDIA